MRGAGGAGEDGSGGDATVRSVGGLPFLGLVLRDGFGLLRLRSRALLTIAALAYLPGILLHLATASVDMSEDTALSWVVILADIALISLAQAAIVFAAMRDLRGQPYSVGLALQAVLDRPRALAGVCLLYLLLALLGALLLIVPGVMVLCACFVALPVCLFEREGVLVSLARSATLTKGRRWPIFGILSVTIAVVVGGMLLMDQVTGTMTSDAALRGLIADVATIVPDAWTDILLAVCYRHLRAMKDGPDVDDVARVFA